MSDFNKFAFAQTLHNYMRAERGKGLRKKAAPMPPGMPPQGMPMDPAMMQDPNAGAPMPEEQVASQQPQETLNIQAKGPEAIDAIKSMMGNAGVQPTQEELMQQLPPEVLAQMQGGMPPKMASFRRGLSAFMQADREDFMRKKAAAERWERAHANVMALIKRAACKSGACKCGAESSSLPMHTVDNGKGGKKDGKRKGNTYWDFRKEVLGN